MLDGKTSIPSELRTAEWAQVTQWERERAFYMAGVTNAEILDEFRKEVAAIAQGETSIPQAERRLGEMLAEIGYAPEPGQEGTIKDLRTWRRMRVALRTNVELLQGWADKERGMTRGAMMAAPAWELIRRFKRNVPRNNPAWEARFVIMGGEIRDGRMIAMKDDRVWQELGNFEDGLGVDYPPFAWGSGMRWKEVGFREAQALGVIPAGWTPPPRQPLSSPNANLQMKPKVSEPALREALSKNLKGMAEWAGDDLIFTDPNGTRPLPGEKLVEIWRKGMPVRFHRDRDGEDDKGLVQRHALKLWAEDHNTFTREVDEKTGLDTKPAPGRLDLYDDLWRLFNRLPATPQPAWRGMSWNGRDSFRAFLASLKNGYQPIPGKVADSWSLAESGARKYAKAGRYQVTLVCHKSRTAKDISALVRSVAGELKQPDAKKPLVTDGEIVFPNGARFRVLKTELEQDAPEGGRATVYVEEI